MSRIGKAPVEIPDKVNVEIQDNSVKATGPKGSLSVSLRPEITVEIIDNKVVLKRSSDIGKVRALHGLSRTLVNNVILGVSQGFEKKLEIHGVGYKAAKEGRNLVLSLGYSHPVKIEPPEGVEVEVEANTKLTVKGIDKQAVGDVAAEIRSKRPPEVYKGKGVRYAGEVIIKKAGKSGKK